MTPQAEDSARLQDLLGDMYAERTPRAATQPAVIDVVLDRLRCRRSACGNSTAPAMTSRSSASPRRPPTAFDTSDRRLRRAEFIDYFNSLVDAGTYVSVDAMNDPALEPMRESYLAANNVVSMLDAAFVLNNRTYGMVCCEEPHRREWKPGDVVSLRAIVNKIALLMWNAPDSVLLKTPSLPLRVLLQESSAAHERRR